MARCITWITLLTLVLSTLHAPRCFAGDATLDEHVARYQETVLPAADDEQPTAGADGGGSMLSQVTGLLLAAADHPTETEVPTPYEPWPERRGPAYPDDEWHSVGRDLRELPDTMWDDTTSVFTNRVVIVGMLAAGGVGAAINGAGCDDTVADRARKHRQLPKCLEQISECFGDLEGQLPVAMAMYATGLWRDDPKLYEVSKTLTNALIINGVTAQALKWTVDTERPDGDDRGWPSGHASSSFCFATVMSEAYGPRWGIPLYVFATFVGYQRIDSRRHDLSDVVSGAIIGTVIGYAVANNHEPKIFGMDVMPLADPNSGTVGIMLAKQW